MLDVTVWTGLPPHVHAHTDTQNAQTHGHSKPPQTPARRRVCFSRKGPHAWRDVHTSKPCPFPPGVPAPHQPGAGRRRSRSPAPGPWHVAGGGVPSRGPAATYSPRSSRPACTSWAASPCSHRSWIAALGGTDRGVTVRCHPSPVSLEPNSQVREHALVRVRGNGRERRGQHRDLVPAPCPPNRACAASRTP